MKKPVYMKLFFLQLALVLNFISTAQQFTQISDINPGTPGSWPDNFIELNNELIFTASTNPWTNQRSIYKSDGTPNGTSLVVNITPHFDYIPDEEIFVKSSGMLFFKEIIYNQGTYSYKLWKTNGTAGGTVLVKDLTNKAYNSNLCEMNGIIYFITSYQDLVWGHTIHELWKSDGTLNGTVAVTNWTNSGLGNNITIRSFNNKIYFSGYESDGTIGGTIQNGVFLPLISESCLLNNMIYYRGNDGKIWKTDGSIAGTLQAVDFPVPYSANFYSTNGWIYFSGGYNGVGLPGNELCKTDGTLANTSMIKDIYFGFNSSNPKKFVDVNGTIFFIANDGINGQELWKTDGSSGGTVLVKDIYQGPNGTSSNDYHGIKHDNQLYFYVQNQLVPNNTGIWKSDGTSMNTVLVHSFVDSLLEMLEINCNLFLSADDLAIPGGGNPDRNAELWCDTSNCNQLGLNLINETKPYQVYPNPTSSEITITSDKFTNEPYTLYDQMGRVVGSGTLAGTNTTISLSTLSKGIYILKVEGAYESAIVVKE
jgi:ELWxxDGT repeat protein